MTTKLFSSALFAGIAAGLIAALLQYWLVTPLLLEGEEYETGAKVHFVGLAEVAGEDHDHSTHSHDEDASTNVSAGTSFVARHAKTIAFNVVVFSGYGLILAAGFALASNFGQQITWRAGLIWGMAGFVALQLAPAAGLYPELPGTPAADILARQYWWPMTVLATIAGIALVAFGQGFSYLAIGIALILGPHVVGAPHLTRYSGVAPPELSALFVARTLFMAMLSWVVLGGIAGYFWSRGSNPET